MTRLAAGFQALQVPVRAMKACVPEKHNVKRRVATPICAICVQPLSQELLHSAWVISTLPCACAPTPHPDERAATLSARMSVTG